MENIYSALLPAKKEILKYSLAFLVLILAQLQGLAQLATIQGVVEDASTGEFVSAADILIIETDQWTISDASGKFDFQDITVGIYTLHVRMLGYKTQSFQIDLNTTDSLYRLQISPLNVELKSVTVTAREASLGSVSKLEGFALKHTQPVSLSDVLQLVPGQLAQNPELGNVAQFTVRQAPTGAASQRMNALGTALILDGAPISNNANLQMNTNILNASPGSLPPFTSVAGRGPDLRAIPADHIESVEVIRGIASAKYGDLSSGAVLVNTRIGAYKPRMLLRINPMVRQLSFGSGFKANDKNTFNAELDITSAVNDPRNDLEQYTRSNLQLGWSNQLNKWHLTHRFTLFTTLNETREAPEDDMARRRNSNQERGIRLNSQGRWTQPDGFFNQMRYIFSASYQHQNSSFQEQVTRDIFPVTDALVDTTKAGIYGQSSYLNQTTVDGRPLNLYARIESGRRVSAFLGFHNLTLGAEWRYDKNFGEGRLFDPLTPPRQNYSMGDRPRSYASIPASNQLGLYLNDKWRLQLSGKQLLVEWGIRADFMHRLAQPNTGGLQGEDKWFIVPAPRINASYALGKGWQARAGYGIMAKMPTLSYLYPNPVFFDLVNFNYFAPNPDERLVMLTTRKIIPNTSPLEPYQSRKIEMGLDYRPNSGGWDVATSFFHEQMDDAYQMLRYILPIENATFQAVAFPEGAPPVLATEPESVDTFMAAYDVPQNNLKIINRGFDFAIQTPKIEALHTSFHLSGAFLHTRSEQTTPFLDANRAVFSNQSSGRVPVFPAGQGQETIRMNTSLRLIHHIPALKLIVSGLIQTIWLEQNRIFGYEEDPEGYLAKDGQFYEIADQDVPEELGRTLNPASFEWQTRPPMWLFNIRLTKEWAPQRGFAFYVNNLINSRPLFTSNISGFQVTRNQPEFFFGAEVYYGF